MKYLVKCRLRGVGSSADSRKCGFEMQLFRATVYTKSFIEGIKDRFTHDLKEKDIRLELITEQGSIYANENLLLRMRIFFCGQ